MAAGTLKSFQRTVTTAGTRVRLYAAGPLEVCEVAIKALSGNTGAIYVGGADVAAANGYYLDPGESVSIASLRKTNKGSVTDDPFVDINNVWLDSASNGDAVSVLYVDRDNG